VRRISDEIDHELLRHTRVHLGDDPEEAFDDAWDEFWPDSPERFDLDGPEMQLFFPWLFFHWLPLTEKEDSPRRTIAESFLEARGRKLDGEWRSFIEAATRGVFSFYEIVSVAPGQGYRLRDVFLGTEVDVQERSGSVGPRAGDLVYGKVIERGGVVIMDGSGSTLLPPREKTRIIDLRSEIEAEAGPFDVETLRDHADDLRELYFEIRTLLHAPLDLRNTDGEKLAFHEITWHCDDREHVLAALRPLGGEEGYAEALEGATRDQSGAVVAATLRWIRETENERGSNALLSSTVLATLSLEGTRLRAEVNSADRAERLRAEVERLAGPLVRHRATVVRSMRRLLDERRDRPPTAGELAARREQAELAQLPEVRAKLRELAARHWSSWLDSPIPALRGRTPREAAADPVGREKVEALLCDAERNARPDDAFKHPDHLTRVRVELGLEPAAPKS
jgi:hypothetical protein